MGLFHRGRRPRPGRGAALGAAEEAMLRTLKTDALARLTDCGILKQDSAGGWPRMAAFEWFWDGYEQSLRAALAAAVNRKRPPRVRALLRLLDDYDGAVFFSIWLCVLIGVNILLAVAVLRLLPD